MSRRKIRKFGLSKNLGFEGTKKNHSDFAYYRGNVDGNAKFGAYFLTNSKLCIHGCR
jgi:hypothetical protein